MTTPSNPVPEFLEFHRLAQLSQPWRWWRPISVLAVALGLYTALLIVPILCLVVIEDVHPTIAPIIDQVLGADSLNDPAGLAVLLILIALMLPAAMLAVRLVGRRRAGTLLSVTGRLRWRLVGRAAAITTVVLSVFTGVILLMEPPTKAIPAQDLGWLVTKVILVLLIVPWQAAAEEVVFRGLLLQTVGSWLRHPAWAILLPLPLFVVGHDYDGYGMAGVAVFAAVAGYLTWRTGGLEAAIGLHVVNNVGAFILALLTGADLDATSVDPLAAALSIAYTLITAVLILGSRRNERHPVASDRERSAGSVWSDERADAFFVCEGGAKTETSARSE